MELFPLKYIRLKENFFSYSPSHKQMHNCKSKQGTVLKRFHQKSMEIKKLTVIVLPSF